MQNEAFIIIDGNSLMYRAFYALPNLTNSKGFHTSVIYGFVNMLNKLMSEFKPQYIGIAFDRKAPTFRHEAYADYKAGRKKMPQEMAEQIPVLKEVLCAMNITQLELDGYEADDIIGTIARHADELRIPTLIVTGDRDAFQLISDYVHVMITKKGISDMEEYDAAKLMEVYSITPQQVPDLKGLMGDASDNIPGVPSIGEKTATELIRQFGSVEGVLANCSEIKKNKVRENIENNKSQAAFSKELATIMREVPIPFEIKAFALKEQNFEKLYALYNELEFKNLLEKLGKVNSEKQEAAFDLIISELNESEQIEAVIEEIRKAGKLSFKMDANGFELIQQIYISVNDRQYHFLINDITIKYLRSLMEDSTIIKIGHDIKKDIIILKDMGIEAANVGFDTMLAAYILNPSKGACSLKEIYNNVFNSTIMDYEDKEGDAGLRFCSSVKAIAILTPKLEEKLKECSMYELYSEVELPLLSILADMEHIGFKVDRNMLSELGAEFSKHIDTLTEKIHTLAGETFNINSTKQLGVILFEKLNLPVVKKTKTGYSTDVEVLEELSGKHPIIEPLLEYRQLLKLKSTYIDGLLQLINSDTERIHSKLNQMVTATGRLSSTDPNLQNIPIKTENGRQIRKVFVPEDAEYILVDADYSQIELRILAHISGDPGLIDAFIDNEDIHTRTASEVFGVPANEVTPLMRKRAKAVNFGIVYGISDFGLAKDLKIPKKEAKAYIEQYFNRYPFVKKYMEDIVAQAKAQGYVTTILNRRRYIPELQSNNALNRNFGERIAMNTPIQGSAADVIKIAMIKTWQELKKRKMKSRLILQVHDELILETYKTELEEVKQIVKDSMEHAMELKVPLTVDLKAGYNWFESK